MKKAFNFDTLFLERRLDKMVYSTHKNLVHWNFGTFEDFSSWAYIKGKSKESFYDPKKSENPVFYFVKIICNELYKVNDENKTLKRKVNFEKNSDFDSIAWGISEEQEEQFGEEYLDLIERFMKANGHKIAHKALGITYNQFIEDFKENDYNLSAVARKYNKTGFWANLWFRELGKKMREWDKKVHD